MSLFRVTCRGFNSRGSAFMSATGNQYKTHYAVADDAGQAYMKVLAFLESKDIGFASDRALEKVELIAGPPPYPACGTLLHFYPISMTDDSPEAGAQIKYGYYSELAHQAYRNGDHDFRPLIWRTPTGEDVRITCFGPTRNPAACGYLWPDAECVGEVVSYIGPCS